jgi:glycosyltransferase involved in cell wall biosynthesis
LFSSFQSFLLRSLAFRFILTFICGFILDILRRSDAKIALVYPAKLSYRLDLFNILQTKYGVAMYFGNLPPQRSQRYSVVQRNVIPHFRFMNMTFTKGLVSTIVKNRYKTLVLLGVNPAYPSYLLSSILLHYIFGVKIIWWGHGTLGNQGRLGEILRLPFYNLSHKILLYSEIDTTDLFNYGFRNKTRTIGNCNSLDSEYHGDFYNAHSKDLRIVFVGRITPRKRLQEFISLLPAINALRLKKSQGQIFVDIIGHSESNVNKNQGNVYYHGYMEPARMKKILLKAHLGVCPGAVGLSALHLAWYGLPVIALKNDIEHGPEINYLKDGLNAFFIKEIGQDYLIDLFERVDSLPVGTINFKISCRDSVLVYSNERVAQNIIESLWD